MNTNDFLRLGIPLGEDTRRATDFVSQFVLSGGDKTKLEEELKVTAANPAPLSRIKNQNSQIKNWSVTPRYVPRDGSKLQNHQCLQALGRWYGSGPLRDP